MTKPVRYYIRKDGEQPTVRTVPVVAPPMPAQPTARAEQPAAQCAAQPRARVSGVRRIREAIKRGGGV